MKIVKQICMWKRLSTRSSRHAQPSKISVFSPNREDIRMFWENASQHFDEPPFNEPSIQATLFFLFGKSEWVDIEMPASSTGWTFYSVRSRITTLTEKAYECWWDWKKIDEHVLNTPEIISDLYLSLLYCRHNQMTHKLVMFERNLLRIFLGSMFPTQLSYFRRFYWMWRHSMSIDEKTGYTSQQNLR